jgi:glutathione S-transferase
MKGRPPGTPKSDDPNKKKRKRNARERDLCDVKIKITEYFPGASLQVDGDANFTAPSQQPILGTAGGLCRFGVLSSFNDTSEFQPGADGQKFWTIQRVNGNGVNGKGESIPGTHKHTLAKSDEIKKNSVQRHLTQQEKDAKKTQVRIAE